MQRRQFFVLLSALAATGLLPSYARSAPYSKLIRKPIPSTQTLIPAIGMGTWLTFDIADDEHALAIRKNILQEFFDLGGGLIDSSPMYGNAEQVLGFCLPEIKNKKTLFAATKVWMRGQWLGKKQMLQSQALWRVPSFNLMQIHNMLDWQVHYETLLEMKQAGAIDYIGITTSHGRRHEALEQALLKQSFDFVQLTYNVVDREVEQSLLPIAKERNIAVIANRPFQGGDLFNRVAGKKLPTWANEVDCVNWAQFFLKFIISHPQITCAIPATSQVAHMRENMGACYGRLADESMRSKMLDYLRTL